MEARRMPEMMNSGDIAFPHLGIYLQNVPKSFQIFGFSLAFYGVILALALLAGTLLAAHEAKVTGQDSDIYYDFVFIGLVFSLIGARLYYVAFAWDWYKDNPLNIFKIREGGLAIYGGVIAAFLTLLVFARIKKKSFAQMADTCVLGLILGQIIGRWGNFMNREAFGGYTDSLFAMRLPVEAVRPNEITAELASHITDGMNYIQVHPTFLYESLWNLMILTLMLLYKKHKKFQGEMCLFYLGGYGIGRFFIEGLRTDQLQWGHTGIAVSQVLGLSLFITSVILDAVVRLRLKKTKSEA